MTNVLVSYFSASGVTKKVAQTIKDALNSDLYEIIPEDKYTATDLDWTNKNSRSSIEMNDKNSRPKISSKIDISDYDTLIIGFPIWWYTAPTIINTFFEENAIKQKDIYIFATSGGSGVNQAFDDLKSAYPENNWLDAKKLNTNVDVDNIKQWIK